MSTYIPIKNKSIKNKNKHDWVWADKKKSQICGQQTTIDVPFEAIYFGELFFVLSSQISEGVLCFSQWGG